MKTLSLILSLFVSTAAFADQCQVLSNYQGIGAKALIEHSIEKAKGFTSLCQNCGETQARFVRATGAITKVKFDGTREQKEWEIQMAGSNEIIDAAYLYVYTNELSTNGNFKWYNLAELVGCSYTGSSRYLTERADNGRHSGVYFNGVRATENN